MVSSWWALVGAGAGIGGYWRDLGGSAIVFTAVKNFIFGKTLKTVEYPTGNLKTVAIRFATVNAIKRAIAEVNGIEDYTDIKQIYKYEDNYWTEPVLTSNDVRNMNDFAWVIWTKSFGKLPSKGVNLKEINAEAEQLLAASQTGTVDKVLSGTPTSSTASIGSAIPTPATTDNTLVRTASGKFVDKNVLEQAQLHSKNAVKVNAIKLITQCRNPELGANAFTEEEAQTIIDLVLKDDSYIISLYSNFKDDPQTFTKYCKKKANELKQQVQSVEEKYEELKAEQREVERQLADLDHKHHDKQRKQELEEQEKAKREEEVRQLIRKYENEIREKTEPASNQKPPIVTTSTESTKSGAVATF